MYLARVEFKIEEKSKYEKGYFIGKWENTKEEGSFLDLKFQSLPRDKNGFQVWDSRLDTDNLLEIRLQSGGN